MRRHEPYIRRAEPADAARIAHITHTAFASQCELYDDWTLPPMYDTEQDALAAMRHGVIMVACDADGALLGSVRGELHGDVCSVGRLVVDPAAQRRGIGRALVLALEHEFPNARRFEIFTGHLSEGPLRLYEALGYARERTEPVHDGLVLVYLARQRDGTCPRDDNVDPEEPASRDG